MNKLGDNNLFENDKRDGPHLSKLAWILISSAIILLVGVVILVIVAINNNHKLDKSMLGFTAVNYLYNFGSLEELDSNMDKLKEITTDEVYNQLTVDNTSRALYVYLKFKSKPSIVEVDDVTDSYVSYHLKTDSISSSRKFIFMYKRNEEGKISNVREVEAIDFVNS